MPIASVQTATFLQTLTTLVLHPATPFICKTMPIFAVTPPVVRAALLVQATRFSSHIRTRSRAHASALSTQAAAQPPVPPTKRGQCLTSCAITQQLHSSTRPSKAPARSSWMKAAVTTAPIFQHSTIHTRGSRLAGAMATTLRHVRVCGPIGQNVNKGIKVDPGRTHRQRAPMDVSSLMTTLISGSVPLKQQRQLKHKRLRLWLAARKTH